MSEIAATSVASRTTGMNGPAPAFKLAQNLPSVLAQIYDVLNKPNGRLISEVGGQRIGNDYVTTNRYSYETPNQKPGDPSVTIDVERQSNGIFTGSVTLSLANDRGAHTVVYAPPPGAKSYPASNNPADFADFLVKELAAGRTRNFHLAPSY